MITAQQFRRDFPEFASDTTYPTVQVNLWLGLANNLVFAPPWDNTPGSVGPAYPIASITWASGIATVTTVAPHGLIVGSSLSLMIGGAVPSAYNGTWYATVTGANTLTFPLALTADPGPATTGGTWQQATNSVQDVGIELFCAHWLVLQKQAADAAASGGTPGLQTGPISNKSLGPGSIGYSIADALRGGEGFWALTTYGTRFFFLADMMGTGPFQIGVGFDPLGPLALNGPAWVGPWPWPSQTGFSS